MTTSSPIIAAALAAALLAPAAAVADAAALIVDAQGVVAPPALPLTEAELGVTFDLGADGEIILIHYASCKESHFRGGEVEVGPLAAKSSGETVSETEVECPRKVAFAEAANASASVVLRGGENRTVIGPRPLFVLLGGAAATIEVRRGGALVGAMDVRGGMARWPSGLPALAPGADYEITLIAGGVSRAAPAAVANGAGVTIVQP